jgi:hypothetical protein
LKTDKLKKLIKTYHKFARKLKKQLEINPHSKTILWQLKTTVPNYQDEGYIANIKKQKQNKW